jgi:hypothetical protein
MELVEVKRGRGDSPLKRFTAVHGRGGGAPVKGQRSVHR